MPVGHSATVCPSDHQYLFLIVAPLPQLVQSASAFLVLTSTTHYPPRRYSRPLVPHRRTITPTFTMTDSDTRDPSNHKRPRLDLEDMEVDEESRQVLGKRIFKKVKFTGGMLRLCRCQGVL